MEKLKTAEDVKLNDIVYYIDEINSIVEQKKVTSISTSNVKDSIRINAYTFKKTSSISNNISYSRTKLYLNAVDIKDIKIKYLKSLSSRQKSIITKANILMEKYNKEILELENQLTNG